MTNPLAQAEEDFPSLSPALAGLINATAASEQKVLNEILATGVNQGWMLRPAADDLATPTPAEMATLLDGLRGRVRPNLTCDDPWKNVSPPPTPIEGDEPGWVVLSQRCDLVRSYAQEPLVEVARATLLSNADETRSARLNSPRFVAFAEIDKTTCWAADLRVRAWIPKDRLPGQTLIQPFDEDRRLKQFRLRLGQRYWRDAVPTDVVDGLQNPLREALSRSAERVRLLRNFSALLGQRTADGRVLVVAVVAAGRDRTEAERDWTELMAELSEVRPDAIRLIEEADSGVYTEDDISLGQFFDMFKLDMDDITYGKKAGPDQAEPPV